MTYSLAFHPDALKEWGQLDQTVQLQFKKKLAERLEVSRVVSARVSGGTDLFKIKLAALGYRLVYKVIDDRVVVASSATVAWKWPVMATWRAAYACSAA